MVIFHSYGPFIVDLPIKNDGISIHMLSHMISHPNTLMGIYINHMISHLVGGLVLCITINNLSIDGGYRPLIRININTYMLSHMISHPNTLMGIYINHIIPSGKLT